MAEAPFQRLILNLAPDGDWGLTDAAIELARRLDARLTLTVIQDDLMLQAVALPFVHEIDRYGGASRPIDPEAVMRHWAGTTDALVRRMTERIERAGIAGEVRVSRSTPGAKPVAADEPGDLILLIEPSDPLARIARPFASDLAAALGGAQDVLFVPHGASSHEGPVAAAAAPGDKRCLAVAKHIAQLLGRQLTAIEVPTLLDGAPGRARSSLIVMTRGAFGLSSPESFAIAARHGAPLLLLRPIVA